MHTIQLNINDSIFDKSMGLIDDEDTRDLIYKKYTIMNP